MIQLLIVGIIIIFILGAMLFSHSQSMQRFAVLEFLLILAIVVVAGLCMTRTQAFMKEQYFELFRVYMHEARLYARDIETGVVEDSEAAWQQVGDELQKVLDSSLPVTTIDGEEVSSLTTAICEKTAEDTYSVRSYRQIKENGLSEKECVEYVEKLAGDATRLGTVCYEETQQDTAVMVYIGNGVIAPAYVLLTEVPVAPLSVAIVQMQEEILNYGAIILLVGTVLLCIVILLQGRQLNRLISRVVRVAEGKESWETLKTAPKGLGVETNEIRKLRNSFGQIASDVARTNYMRYKVLQGYYRFAPKQIETIFGKQSIVEVDVNDRINVNGTIAFVAYAEKKRLQEQEYLKKLNWEQELLSEKQKEYGGILISDNSDLTTMQLLFGEETKQALHFGVDMVAEKESGRDNQVFVLLHRTSFVYGVAGDEEQAFTYVISKEMKILEKYVERLRAAGIHMAVTDSVYEMIEKETSGRYIGYLEEDGCTFKLYEILDACPAKERQRRIDAKAKFDKALNLFYQGDYYLGRSLFTEVLKLCPEDEVAKWYLFLCEKCLNAENQKDISCALFSD